MKEEKNANEEVKGGLLRLARNTYVIPIVVLVLLSAFTYGAMSGSSRSVTGEPLVSTHDVRPVANFATEAMKTISFDRVHQDETRTPNSNPNHSVAPSFVPSAESTQEAQSMPVPEPALSLPQRPSFPSPYNEPISCSTSFLFDPIPSWGAQQKGLYKSKDSTSPQTNVGASSTPAEQLATHTGSSGAKPVTQDRELSDCVPLSGETLTTERITSCLKANLRTDNRSPVEYSRAVLRRTRSLTRFRLNHQVGCTAKGFGQLLSGAGSLIWVTPPAVEVFDAPPQTYHYAEQLARVVRRPSFLRRWRTLKVEGVFMASELTPEEFQTCPSDSPQSGSNTFSPLLNRSSLRPGRWSEAEGFPVLLQFGDFADETNYSCTFGAYGEHSVSGMSYTVWDPYFAFTGEHHVQSYAVTAFSKYAKEVFGDDWASHDLLSLELAERYRAQMKRVDPKLGSVNSSEGLIDVDSYGNTTWEEELNHQLLRALNQLPRWESRKSKIYFRGNPTHRIREYLVGSSRSKSLLSYGGSPQRALRAKSVLDLVVKNFYKGHPTDPRNVQGKAKFEPFQDSYNNKAVLSLRGKNAALRDRLNLLSGAAQVRVMNVEVEPIMAYHDMMQPYVHYLPFFYRSKEKKLRKSSVTHLAAMTDILADLILSEKYEAELQLLGYNALRIAAIISSEDFRDAVFEEILMLYLVGLDVGGAGPDPIPLSKEGLHRMFRRSLRQPPDGDKARYGSSKVV